MRKYVEHDDQNKHILHERGDFIIEIASFMKTTINTTLKEINNDPMNKYR